MIRLATNDDIPSLHALIERAYRGDAARAGWTHEADLLDGPRTDAATLAALIADSAQAFLIAVDGDAIVACVAVSDRGNGVCYLGQLAVDPARQTGGLGRTMIAAAEARARDLGATIMEMTVIGHRAELVAYYERRGYALTGERRAFPYEQPAGLLVELHVMVKRL